MVLGEGMTWRRNGPIFPPPGDGHWEPAWLQSSTIHRWRPTGEGLEHRARRQGWGLNPGSATSSHGTLSSSFSASRLHLPKPWDWVDCGFLNSLLIHNTYGFKKIKKNIYLKKILKITTNFFKHKWTKCLVERQRLLYWTLGVEMYLPKWCWSPNPQDLWIWPYLETRSFLLIIKLKWGH